MTPRIPPRMPASIGSNQASPANKLAACAACIVVLLSSMAWSPPARRRRSWLVGQAGDYATVQFHHLRDGTMVFGPVRDPAPLFRDAVTAISIGLERHRGSRVTEGVILLRQPSPHADRPIRAQTPS